MVLVFGSAATPTGRLPTGMVAVTVIQSFASWAMARAGAADAVAAVVVGASPVMAMVIRHAARWVNLMMSGPLLAWPWQARYPSPGPARASLVLRLAARTGQYVNR